MVTTRSQSKRTAGPEEYSGVRRSKRAKTSRRSQGRKNVKAETVDPAEHKEPHGVIDHLGFAHIIDAILDYGGPEVWRMFRATCKLYHARIPGPANRIVMSRKRGEAYAAIGRPGAIPISNDDCLDGSKKASKLGNLPLTLTRTLDIRNGVSRVSQLPWADDFANVKIVRSTTEGYPMIPAPVYVLTCDMNLFPYKYKVSPPTAMITVERAMDKLVVATHFSRLSPTTRHLEFYFARFPSRLVFHFMLDQSHKNWSEVQRMITSLAQQLCRTATTRGAMSDLSRIPPIEFVDIHKLFSAWVTPEASLVDAETQIRKIWNNAIEKWGSARTENVPELKAVLSRKLRISTAETYASRERIEERDLWIERGLHFGRQRVR